MQSKPSTPIPKEKAFPPKRANPSIQQMSSTRSPKEKAFPPKRANPSIQQKSSTPSYIAKESKEVKLLIDKSCEEDSDEENLYAPFKFIPLSLSVPELNHFCLVPSLPRTCQKFQQISNYVLKCKKTTFLVVCMDRKIQNQK
jgi:hypothetical protein